MPGPSLPTICSTACGDTAGLVPAVRGRAGQKAHAWWREHRPAAPFAVRDEVARAVELVAVQPGLGAPATNVRLRGVRRILLSRIGYWLYYRETADGIDVLAFWHTKRSAGPAVR